MVSLTEKILELGKKKIIDEDTGIEREIELFNYSEILQTMVENHVQTDDVLQMWEVLLSGHLAIGYAKVLSGGGVGQEATYHIDITAIDSVMSLLKKTIETRNMMKMKETT